MLAPRLVIALNDAFREIKRTIAPNVDWYVLTEDRVKGILEKLIREVQDESRRTPRDDSGSP